MFIFFSSLTQDAFTIKQQTFSSYIENVSVYYILHFVFYAQNLFQQAFITTDAILNSFFFPVQELKSLSPFKNSVKHFSKPCFFSITPVVRHCLFGFFHWKICGYTLCHNESGNNSSFPNAGHFSLSNKLPGASLCAVPVHQDSTPAHPRFRFALKLRSLCS